MPSDPNHDTAPPAGAALSCGEIDLNGWRIFPAPWAWRGWWAVIPPASSAIEAFLETDLDLAVSAVLKSTGPAGYAAWRQLQLGLPEQG